MKFLSTAVLVAALLGGVFTSQPARAESVLNHLLPWVFGPPEEGPKPEDTLQAPFGKDRPPQSGSQVQAGLMEMYNPNKSIEDTTALDTPHRNDQQIGEWVTDVVTRSLTIDPRTYGVSQTEFGPLMTPFATKEYQSFLEKNGILEMLKSNNMKLVAVAESRPELIQAGALDGSYRWLYKIPLMLTYYEQSTTSLKGIKKAAPQIRRITLSVQVGRVPKNLLADEMMVERWIVTSG